MERLFSSKGIAKKVAEHPTTALNCLDRADVDYSESGVFGKFTKIDRDH